MDMNRTLNDDFTQIRGIGDMVQERLREVFGVQTFAQLANLNAAEIEVALKADKSIPAPARTHKKIEQWLMAAGQLADASGAAEQKPLLAVAEAAVKKREEVKTPTRGVDWQPIASFVIEFQSRVGETGGKEMRTAVHHMEGDRETHWSGIEQEKLCRWIVDEADVAHLVEESSSIRPSKKGAVPESMVELAPVEAAGTMADNVSAPAFSWEKDVRALWVAVSQSQEPAAVVDVVGQDKPFLAHVDHERPLNLEFNFALPNLTGTGTQSLKCRAYCQFNNMEELQKQDLFEMKTIEPGLGQSQMTASLSKVTLDPGIYEVGVLVRGERPLGAHYFRFPKLNVL